MLKLIFKCKEIEIDMECGTKHSSDPSVKSNGSLFKSLIYGSLELVALIEIWKYILLPLL